MYKSFKKFNSTPMYFGNIDCTKKQLQELKDLGVTIVETDISLLKENKLSFNFIDWFIYQYLIKVKYDKVMWIDADTMVLQNIEELFVGTEDFIGHPGRNNKGPILVEGGMTRFAGGVWVGTQRVINMLWFFIQEIKHQKAESMLLTRLLYQNGIVTRQLDPSIWNFSRELIKEAKVDKEGKIYYDDNIYPKTIGFSKNNKKIRCEVKVIDDWYDKNIKLEPFRAYKNYEEYVKHQSSKANKIRSWLKTYDMEFFKQIVKRVKGNKGKVLCLGARTGAEVLAFENKECEAVGIDLYPTKNSYKTIKGDFHNIPFKDNEFDIVFTNSLDHSLDLNKMISEIVRVLKNYGIFIFEAEYGVKEKGSFKEYEVTKWDYISELVNKLKEHGFIEGEEYKITMPCKGKHIEMRLIK